MPVEFVGVLNRCALQSGRNEHLSLESGFSLFSSRSYEVEQGNVNPWAYHLIHLFVIHLDPEKESH